MPSTKSRQQQAGLQALSPHDFRRSMITKLLKARQDVLIVSDLRDTQTQGLQNSMICMVRKMSM